MRIGNQPNLTPYNNTTQNKCSSSQPGGDCNGSNHCDDKDGIDWNAVNRKAGKGALVGTGLGFLGAIGHHTAVSDCTLWGGSYGAGSGAVTGYQWAKGNNVNRGVGVVGGAAFGGAYGASAGYLGSTIGAALGPAGIVVAAAGGALLEGLGEYNRQNAARH